MYTPLLGNAICVCTFQPAHVSLVKYILNIDTSPDGELGTGAAGAFSTSH